LLSVTLIRHAGSVARLDEQTPAFFVMELIDLLQIGFQTVKDNPVTEIDSPAVE